MPVPGVQVDRGNKKLLVTQSFLQDFQRCPERARRQIVDPKLSFNDATCLGSAVHLFVEYRMQGKPYIEAHRVGLEFLHEMTEREDFVWAVVQTLPTLLAHYDTCCMSFDMHVVPQVSPGGDIERTLRADLCTYKGWLIQLEGTPDYVDPFGRVWDWKTSRDDFSVFEANNWMIQPTAYTFLASQDRDSPVTEFTYAVAIKPSGVIQLLDVSRSDEDWAWLARIATDVVELLALPGRWPVRHGHYLCSAKWCPWWDTCRGASVKPE
jgi:hypothetical protein